jgi:hypothetical protein
LAQQQLTVRGLALQRVQRSKGTRLPYPNGLGAVTAGIISGLYLIIVSPALSAGIISLQLIFGMVLMFMAATLLNTLVAGAVLISAFKGTRGLSDYASGAMIGATVTYATVIFYFFSLV